MAHHQRVQHKIRSANDMIFHFFMQSKSRPITDLLCSYDILFVFSSPFIEVFL